MVIGGGGGGVGGRGAWRQFRIQKVPKNYTILLISGFSNTITEKICSAHIISTLLCAQGANLEKPGQAPFSFTNKCPVLFYVHYTTHGTYSFTSHPKDEAIMVKCLAQGHKDTRTQGRDQPGRDSNTHSDNTRTWVLCTRPLGHDTPQCRSS